MDCSPLVPQQESGRSFAWHRKVEQPDIISAWPSTADEVYS